MCKCRGEISDIDLNIYLYFSLKKSSRCSTAGRGQRNKYLYRTVLPSGYYSHHLQVAAQRKV